MLYGGSNVGYVNVTEQGDRIDIEMAISNNGRGLSSNETVRLAPNGLPRRWHIEGKTHFGNEVDESFSVENGIARWRSAAGEGSADYSDPAI